MKRRWFRNNPSRIDPDELTEHADVVMQKIQGQQPRVNVLTTFLERRRLENGFGTDFEYTLRPKEAS